MTAEELYGLNPDEIKQFIREKLAFPANTLSQLRIENSEILEKQHRRFEMSGYDAGETGSCTLHNLAILNEFAYLGLYDYTEYLFLDFYKGHGTLYWKYFGGGENQEQDFGGYGTTEIIYEVFLRTILSGKPTRRR